MGLDLRQLAALERGVLQGVPGVGLGLGLGLGFELGLERGVLQGVPFPRGAPGQLELPRLPGAAAQAGALLPQRAAQLPRHSLGALARGRVRGSLGALDDGEGVPARR